VSLNKSHAYVGWINSKNTKFQVQSTPLLCIRTSRCLSVAVKTSKCTNVISPPASSLVMSHELWQCVLCVYVTLFVDHRFCKNNATANAANDVEHFLSVDVDDNRW